MVEGKAALLLGSVLDGTVQLGGCGEKWCVIKEGDAPPEDGPSILPVENDAHVLVELGESAASEFA